MSQQDQDLSGFSMMDLFRTEVEMQAVLLNEGLLALEGDFEAKEQLESLMRAAHSAKGAARIVGLDSVVRIAHAMEDCFVAAQKGEIYFRAENIDILLKGVDWLVRVSRVAEADLHEWFLGHQA